MLTFLFLFFETERHGEQRGAVTCRVEQPLDDDPAETGLHRVLDARLLVDRRAFLALDCLHHGRQTCSRRGRDAFSRVGGGSSGGNSTLPGQPIIDLQFDGFASRVEYVAAARKRYPLVSWHA